MGPPNSITDSSSKAGDWYLKLAFSHAGLRAVQHYPEIRAFFKGKARKNPSWSPAPPFPAPYWPIRVHDRAHVAETALQKYARGRVRLWQRVRPVESGGPLNPALPITEPLSRWTTKNP